MIRKANEDDRSLIISKIVQWNENAAQHCLHIDCNEDSITEEINNLTLPLAESFYLYEDNGNLQALIGWEVNPQTEDSWVYGPFYDASVSKIKLGKLLQTLITSRPSIKRIFGFYDETATVSIDLMRKQNFKVRPEVTVLEFEMDNFQDHEMTLSPEISITKTLKQDGDLKSWKRLHEQAFEVCYISCQEMLDKVKEETGFVQYIYLNDEFAGYIFAEDYGESSDEVYIHFIATTPHLRRKGYGDKLINSVISWTNQVGRGKVCLSVKSENIAAVELYRKNGFDVLYRGQSLFKSIK